MRVLITNLFLANNSGSEVVVEMLADGLRRAGHHPMVLAPTLGPQASRMRARGHIVVDRISALPAIPDIIHAQHTPVALSALAAFPATPSVFSCHSANFEVEAPRPHPQIRRWIAVDDLCRDRCLSRGIPADRLTVVLNAVDLERFARRSPLPERPRRALLLAKNAGHAEAIRAACASHDVELVELGPAFGRISHEIERELLSYDLVFATARMALEAAAVGCAVVVCDGRGFAGLLVAGRLSEWRRFNFGAGLLARPVTQPLAVEAIAAYDASDAGLVTDRLRTEASLTDCIAQHIAVYEAALADPRPSPQDVAAGTASWIEELVPMSRGRSWEVIAREKLGLDADVMAVALAASEQRLAKEMARLADQNAQRIGRELGDRIDAETGRAAANVTQSLAAEADRIADNAAQSMAAETNRITDAVTRNLTETSQRLTDISRELSAQTRMLAEASRESAADIGSQVEDARRDIVARIENRPIRAFFGKAWRTVMPRTVRAPLFRLRQRLLGRKPS